MMDADDSDLEIAEEAELSLNPSVADSQSIFGDSRYERDFDRLPGSVSPRDDNVGNDEPKLKYERLSSELKDIISHDKATAVAVNSKFMVVGKCRVKIFSNSLFPIYLI